MAALPFKKADEPLGAIMHINNIIAKRGEAVLAAFKAALKQAEAALGTPAAADGGATSVGLDDTPAAQLAASAGGAAATPTAAQQQAPPAAEAAAAGLAEACDASLAVSMLLQLKQFLLRSYSLAPERAALYASASSEKKRQVRWVAFSMPNTLKNGHCCATCRLCGKWGMLPMGCPTHKTWRGGGQVSAWGALHSLPRSLTAFTARDSRTCAPAGRRRSWGCRSIAACRASWAGCTWTPPPT